MYVHHVDLKVTVPYVLALQLCNDFKHIVVTLGNRSSEGCWHLMYISFEPKSWVVDVIFFCLVAAIGEDLLSLGTTSMNSRPFCCQGRTRWERLIMKKRSYKMERRPYVGRVQRYACWSDIDCFSSAGIKTYDTVWELERKLVSWLAPFVFNFFFHPNNRQLRDGVLFMSSLEQLHSVFNFQAQEPVFCDPMALCFWSEISRKEASCTALFRMDESRTALYCAFWSLQLLPFPWLAYHFWFDSWYISPCCWAVYPSLPPIVFDLIFTLATISCFLGSSKESSLIITAIIHPQIF